MNSTTTTYRPRGENMPTPMGATSAASSLRVGYSVGAGGEWKFAPAWSLKLEYLYYNLGRNSAGATTVQFDAAAANGTRFIARVRPTHDADGHIVRAGLNYQFGASAAPVVAKY